jgi:hypothetical protein
VFNDTLVNYFGRGTIGKISHNLGNSNTIQCQLCKSYEHIASTCLKLVDLGPKCTKCGGGHKIENYCLKCSFCLGMGHIEDSCSRKNGKGPFASVNFLEVLVNDEKTTLIELS